MKDNFADVEQRVKRYWYTDGIGELAGGGLFLVIGLYFAGHEWTPPNSTIRTLLDSSLAILLIGGVFVTRWLINLLKTRLTYPRTGYVEYYPSKKNTSAGRVWTAVIAMVVSAVLVFFGKWVGSFNWMPGFTGLVAGVIFIMICVRADGPRRFYLLGGFSILLGVILSFSKLSESYSLGLFYGLLGVVAMISGGVTLASYLRMNPLQEGENHG